MIENDLDKVLNYMKRYVENVYEHDSEIMLNWKDIKLVLEEIERLKDLCDKYEEEHKTTFEEWKKAINIIKEVREYIKDRYNGEVLTHTFDKDNVGELLEILDKENKQ